MDFFQNGKSLGNQLSADDLIAMQDSQTGDRGYAKLSDVIVEGVNSLATEQRAAVRAGIGAAAISDTAEQFYSLSYPMILSPSGSFSTTDGQFTLGTALPAIPNGVVGDGGNAKIYLPASAGGLAAGWYSAVFSSTTAGQLVGTPVTTATSWTQSTSQVTAVSVLIPGDSVLSTGSIEIETATSNNGSAGVKSVRYGVDAANVYLSSSAASQPFDIYVG